MREVAQNVALVETCHRDFRDHHFKERRKCGEHAKLILVEAESSGGGEVAAFHYARRYEDFWVLLVNRLEARRSLQIS